MVESMGEEGGGRAMACLWPGGLCTVVSLCCFLTVGTFLLWALPSAGSLQVEDLGHGFLPFIIPYSYQRLTSLEKEMIEKKNLVVRGLRGSILFICF